MLIKCQQDPNQRRGRHLELSFETENGDMVLYRDIVVVGCQVRAQEREAESEGLKGEGTYKVGDGANLN